MLDQCDTASARARGDSCSASSIELERGCSTAWFDTPDRVQHLFWRYLEPDHPANRGRTSSPAYAEVIEAQYRRGDAIVGQALEQADDDTPFIVLSDHGFGSFWAGST